MAIRDPRRLRAVDLLRLLNSTPLGAVVDRNRLRRHRDEAGLRISSPQGDGSALDLFRYAAWLRRRARRSPHAAVDPYLAHKERARVRAATLSHTGRDIGEIPPVAQPLRRDAATQNFRAFCDSYFPHTFTLPWSPDHLKVIARIEEAVLHGGLFAMAMPRGSGKTTLAECACVWATLTGARDFVALIGSNESHAASMLESIKTEFETNDLLHEDFPEVVHPVRALEGMAQRCVGQLHHGERTFIGWTARELVLPMIAESPASGAVIRVAGLTGQIRGMKFKRADGRSSRPSLVIIDDPQTDESARSPSQCAERERILAGAVLGLAGPGRKISGIMPCTVIRPDDMADRILDRTKHPEWNGERTKLIYAFPAADALWQEYATIRAQSLKSGGRGDEATRFYAAKRAQMDAGAVVAWPERFHHDELSAVQHVMNLRLERGDHAFFAEYQNEPLAESTAADGELDAEQVAAKTNGRARGEVPRDASHLTAFIDVQQKVLYWLVAAWEDDFTGYVVDYGSWPDQKSPYFTVREVRRTLQQASPRAGLEGAIYAGLETLVGSLASRVWRRDDGSEARVDRVLVDANWGESTDVVYQYCRQSAHAALVLPSHGRYVGASSIPFAEYRRKRGDRMGFHWRIPAAAGRRAVRHALVDTNHWKSFVHARLAVPMGDPGCLSLFGRQGAEHRMFADHVTSETRVRTTARGRTVDEWKLKAPGLDNHWLDCLVGAAAAASVEGAALLGIGARAARHTPTRLSSLRRERIGAVNR